MSSIVVTATHDHCCTITLNDPARRNALSVELFAALGSALRAAHAAADASTSLRVVRLCGAGPAFCAGFDLAACVERPVLLRALVLELSNAVRALRALPVPVVAQVHGAALAGGCALLAGCDFVLVAPDAQLGYPVHRIGVSPAVSLPALMPSAGAGRARATALGGDLLTGQAAVAAGLAWKCASSTAALPQEAAELCARLAQKGPLALRATKAWITELDGTLDPARAAHAAAASAAAAEGDEFATMLRAFWAARSSGGTS